MIRTHNNEYKFKVSNCQIVSDGSPFLRVTCVNVDPGDFNSLKSQKLWHLEGCGGPHKAMAVAVHRRHHMPDVKSGVMVEDGLVDASGFPTGNGTFSYDVVVDLFMPRGVIEIQFSKYNDERDAREREERRLAEERKAAEKIEHERMEKLKNPPVDTFRRNFQNLELKSKEAMS